MEYVGSTSIGAALRCMRRALGLGALVLMPAWAEAQPGTVIGHQKISDLAGDFGGTLDDLDNFGGRSIASLGDLDGNGVPDVAVSAWADDDGGPNRGAVWILFLEPDGSVLSEQKLSYEEGGFLGILDNGDTFGDGSVGLGDLDGDGVTDLAVGASGDDDQGPDRGAVWIVFLNADGTAKSEQKISDSFGGLTGALGDADGFGLSVGRIGDLDGDGRTEIAVGAPGNDDGGTSRGAVWILFLDADGTVRAEQKISDTAGGFTGVLDDSDLFGVAVAGIGDLDGDGIRDLAVGAHQDDDGGPGRGAVWILFLNADGTVKAHQKISDTVGELLDPIPDGASFGFALASLGDIDGDDIPDLAVGAPLTGSGKGAVWTLFLDDDGTVKGSQTIGDGVGGFSGTLDDGDLFGISLGAIGDVDGNAVGELVVGAQADDDGGLGRGAAWVLFLDGEPCGSGPAATASCKVAPKTSLLLVDKPDDTKDKLIWKWRKGAQTLLTELGDPVGGATEHTFCIWDHVGDGTTLALRAAVPAGAGWQTAGTTGFKYDDRLLQFDGVQKIAVRVGAHTKAKQQLKGRGLNLPMPSPVSATAFFHQGPAVTAQLLNSDGTCWTSSFGADATSRNVPGLFKAKTR